MSTPADGQVHKVVRVVGTSTESWEAAAQAAVAEASTTIHDLRTAEVIQADLVIDGASVVYRVKLETLFQLDRSRVSDDGETYRARRYLVVANQTLASPALHQLLAERDDDGRSEFHILVPEGPRVSAHHLVDPLGFDVSIPMSDHDRLLALAEAEERLESFRHAFAHLGPRLTGEVGPGDPMSAARRVFEYATFDEIIVSTLPPGMSRWLKLDLPSRLERVFHVPVIALIQDNGSG
ncbi:MAG: dodecin domain-containing protein [Acidimicrobiales bacterium]